MRTVKIDGLTGDWLNCWLAICLLLVAMACDKKPEATPDKVPIVTTAVVEAQTVPVYMEFPGSLDALTSVELLARVEGFLIARHFDEGSNVKKGNLLYEIDPKPFQVALKKAVGELAQNRAALIDAQKRLERQTPLAEQDFISRQAFDNLQAQVKEHEGQVEASQAEVENAKLNLGYCSIYAPFSGRIGYTEVDVGNLVSPSKNPKLAELVQTDPIYAVFRPDNKILGQITEQQAKAPIPVSLSVSDNGEFDHPGHVDSIDNQIDPATNTIKVRAVIPNPKNLLVPGEYTKVRAFLGDRPDTLLVPQAALDQQQGGFQVFVLNNDDTVTAQTVALGSVYQNMRVVLDGLKPGDEVAVSGLQKLKSGSKVKRQVKTGSSQPSAASSEPQPAKPDEPTLAN